MSEDSKKRNELKKQILSKAQVADIKLVERVAGLFNSPKKWAIVELATTIPSNGEVENKKFVICFDYLNWKTCVFDQFDATKGKKLIEIFKKVTDCETSKFPELRLVRDSVGRKGVYELLFSCLSEDVSELKETELGEGRVFFFIIEAKFYVVSIETKHRNV